MEYDVQSMRENLVLTRSWEPMGYLNLASRFSAQVR